MEGLLSDWLAKLLHVVGEVDYQQAVSCVADRSHIPFDLDICHQLLMLASQCSCYITKDLHCDLSTCTAAVVALLYCCTDVAAAAALTSRRYCCAGGRDFRY